MALCFFALLAVPALAQQCEPHCASEACGTLNGNILQECGGCDAGTPDTHIASFVLPSHVARMMPAAPRLHELPQGALPDAEVWRDGHVADT